MSESPLVLHSSCTQGCTSLSKATRTPKQPSRRQPDLYSEADRSIQGTGEAVSFPVALLALGSIQGLGVKSLRQLVGRFGEELGDVFRSEPEELASLFESEGVQGGAKIAGRVSAEAELLTGKGRAQLQQLSQRGVKIISPSGLPDRLAQAKPLAKWLFVEGDPKAINNRPMVAVVGTRKPSEEGLSATRRIVCMLSEYPIGLVSGLAEGIDATAHRTSVAQHMQNVAFLGHGIDQIFPAATADLRAEIVHCGGAVATEYLPSVHFQKHYFVERNRLQAALADLVLPVEAATNGGTAHTVRFALALGRPIIGIRWKGARGVFEELEKLGHPVIDIDRPEGWRYLDTVLRSLVERAGKPSYPLESFEQRLISEMKYRSIRVDDLQRLHQAVVAALERLGHVPDEQSRDLRLQHTADR